METTLEKLIAQIVEKIDEVDYDLLSFVAGFVYGMQINKIISESVEKKLSQANDLISTKILQHYNFKITNLDENGV